MKSVLDGPANEAMSFRDRTLQYCNHFTATVLESFSSVSNSNSERVVFLLKESEKADTLYKWWLRVANFFNEIVDIITITKEQNPHMMPVDRRNFNQHLVNLKKLHRYIRDPEERVEEMLGAINGLVHSHLDNSDSNGE